MIILNICRHENLEKKVKGRSLSDEAKLRTASAIYVCSDALSAGVSLVNTLAQEASTSSPAGIKDALKVPLVCCVLLARCQDNLARSLSVTLVTLLTDDTLPCESSNFQVNIPPRANSLEQYGPTL